MSKRLQVLFEEDELAELQRTARQNRMTASEWVRQVVRQAQRNQPRGDPKKKLAAIRRAAEHSFPTGDIDQMLAEIERGYVHDEP
jgi:hypothetical protein